MKKVLAILLTVSASACFAASSVQDKKACVIDDVNVKKAAVDTKTRTPDQDKALRDAAKVGDLALVTSLLEAGADVNSASDKGSTALILASQKGYISVVVFLLFHGAMVDTKTTSGGTTALMWAAKQGYEGIVQALLGAGASVDLTDDNGNTALIVASAHADNNPVVAALVAAGANVNAVNKDGKTPLSQATFWGQTDIMASLVKAGAH